MVIHDGMFLNEEDQMVDLPSENTERNLVFTLAARLLLALGYQALLLRFPCLLVRHCHSSMPYQLEVSTHAVLVEIQSIGA